MTILPDDRYLSRWQRAKARAHALVADFKSWCANGNATMPEWWSPEKFERDCTKVLTEMERRGRNSTGGDYRQ
jgi:hypothetical protein